MKLAGVSTTSGSLDKTNSDELYYTAENISCVVAETEKDRCEITKRQKIVEPKFEYNESYPQKRIITGIGYCLFIVPGIIAKIIYDSEKNDAIKESKNLETVHKSDCN